MLFAQFVQIFNIVHTFSEDPFCHFFEMWIDIKLCLPDPLLTPVIVGATPFLDLAPKMDKILIMFPFVPKIGPLHNIFNKNLLFIFPQILFIRLQFPTFDPLLLDGFLWVIHIALFFL